MVLNLWLFNQLSLKICFKNNYLIFFHKGSVISAIKLSCCFFSLSERYINLSRGTEKLTLKFLDSILLFKLTNLLSVRLKFSCFPVVNFKYTLDNRVASNKAPWKFCLVFITSSFLHKESKFTVCPGNSFLAILIVSITEFLILLKPQFCNSLLIKFVSNSAL